MKGRRTRRPYKSDRGSKGRWKEGRHSKGHDIKGRRRKGHGIHSDKKGDMHVARTAWRMEISLARKDRIVADDIQEHRRRSVRLKGFDYARAGAYYVTISAAGQRNIFGEIVNGAMRLNQWGKIAEEEWIKTGEIRPYVRLDAFVVMPNHIHGILIIDREDKQQQEETEARATQQRARQERAKNEGARYEGATYMSPVQAQGPKPQSIGAIIGCYKAAVSRRFRAICETPGMVVWHRNYYEHIIRNDRDWNRVRAYIRENPERWDEDEENPLRKG
jgi:putative transposase